MKHCILQDSSFLVATMDNTDDFHEDAVYIFKKLLEYRREIKVVIPSLVFYETIITLTKKGGVPRAELERKLWNFLYHDMILNVSLIETNAFKICKRLGEEVAKLRTQDFIIANVGMEYEAQILTFDKDIRHRIGAVYNDVYYGSYKGNMPDETIKFLEDLNKRLGKGTINLDEIPF